MRVLNKLFLTKVLNIILKVNWSIIWAEHFEEMYREIKNSEKITLHTAASKEKRAQCIEISCNCTKQCDTKWCTCFKNNVECTQYCHSENWDYDNMSTILDSTEKSIVSHMKTVTINSHKRKSNQSSIFTVLLTWSKTSQVKRLREDITTSTTTSSTKSAVKKTQKNASAVEFLGS